MESLWHDVRFGLRSLAANRRFTVVALLTIVLTVGGITTVFTLVNSILLRPLPHPNTDRLAVIKTIRLEGFLGFGISRPEFLHFRNEIRTFESIGLYRLGSVNTLDEDIESLRIQMLAVTPEMFPLLGIQTVVGRPLLPEDANAENPDVAVISYELWQTRFGAAADIIGKTLQFPRNVNYTIVGVAAAGADIPTNWLTYPAVWSVFREPYSMDRRARTLRAMALVRPGISLESVNEELQRLSVGLAADYPESNQGILFTANALLDEVVGDTKRVLLIFLASVSCVLMIGIANLISLQIVRNSAREREICVRAALGASWRLVRQLLLEALLLSVAGGLAGIVVAWAGIRAVLATLPARFPRADEIAIDSNVCLFAFGVSVLVGIVFGIIPACRASQPDLNAGMNEGSRSATLSTRRSRIQRLLIAFETAVALVLLIGAALLINSFGRLIAQDAGMQEDNLWTVTVGLPLRYRTAGEQTLFWTTAMENIRELPQVQSAAIMVNAPPPISGADMLIGGILPEGDSRDPREGLSMSARNVGPDYFGTLGIPILKGRPILSTDIAGSEEVAVINERAAAALWPGEDPIGKRFGSFPPTTVVGVIPDFKHARLDGEVAPQMYRSYFQEGSSGTSAVIMIRANPEVGGIGDAVRSMISRIEGQADFEMSTMSQVRWRLLATQRFRAGILLIFAAGATFLALIGIFGVVSYSVVQRHREIGLRVALGATYSHVVGLMLKHALIPAVIGLAVGIVGSLAATRLLSTFLFDIDATDPLTFVVAVVVLAVAAFVAGLLPARSALAIDPMAALRHE